MNEELKIFKVADVSTQHVLEADLKRLKEEDCAITAYEFEYGVFVYLSKDIEPEYLQKQGYSEGFQRIWKASLAAGCRYVVLDCDGEDYAELFPTYDW